MTHRRTTVCLFLILATGVAPFVLRPLPAQADPPTESRSVLAPAASLKAQPFDVKDVRILDGPFRANQVRDLEYLLSIDSDRLLHMFRVTAGLPSTAKPLGGWESPHCWVRGHSLGHYLTASALLFAATGDERLKTKADAIVAELPKCQEALPRQGCHPGYLAAIPEEHYDNLDAGRQVWAPWYVHHKIMAGLLDMYLHCDNRLHHQRFTVYWRLCTEPEWRKEASAREAARLARDELQPQIVDEILFGDISEHAHKLQGKRTSEAFRNRVWVESERGGEFSFELQVQPDRSLRLRCTYWGEEREETVQLFTGKMIPTGPRQFDILVDDRKIATQSLKPDKPGEFFDVEYAVPEELTRGKTHVTVKFKAPAGATAGRLFGCMMLKAKDS